MSARFDSINPSNCSIIQSYEEDSERSIDFKIRRLKSEVAPLEVRQQALTAIGQKIRAHREALATLATLEMGKPITEARAEVDKCAWLCEYYADAGPELLADISVETGRRKSYVTHRPLGTVLAIMPWNFPYWQVFRVFAPNFLLGNSLLVKPALNTIGCARLIEQLCRDIEPMHEAFELAVVSTERVPSLISDHRISGVTLTGSTKAGRAVAAIAGQHLKPAVLELGGSDPYLVLQDADLALAARECAAARLLNAGQSCIAAKRIIVNHKIEDDFVAALKAEFTKYPVGDPIAETTRIGPLARADLRDEVASIVRSSLDEGARIAFGNVNVPPAGYYYAPQILEGVKQHFTCANEELFGPVAVIISSKTEEEAISIANASSFGLGAAIFTNDRERGEAIGRFRLQAGMVFINEFVKSDPRLPFGGIKASGFGRELAREGLMSFANIKNIVIG